VRAGAYRPPLPNAPKGPAVTLFETHLAVADLARSSRFYEDVVGRLPALREPERNVASTG